jgi:hypothetical protein
MVVNFMVTGPFSLVCRRWVDAELTAAIAGINDARPDLGEDRVDLADGLGGGGLTRRHRL